MKNTNKKIRSLIFVVISILILSSIAFAVSNVAVPASSNSGKVKDQNREAVKKATATEVKSSDDVKDKKAIDFKNMKDADIAKLLASKYIKSQEEILKMKESLGSWQKVQSELEKFLGTLKLSQQQKIDLFNQGYKIQDIDQAEGLALTYGITPGEILKMKNNSVTKENKALDKATDNKTLTSKDASKTEENSWEDVRLLLDVKKSVQMSDLSLEEAKQIEADIHNKKGMGGETTKDIEKKMLKANDVTEEEIALCKKNGIINNFDIAFAKSFSKKYNTSLQKVLDLKKEKGNWNDVKNELEVAVNEK